MRTEIRWKAGQRIMRSRLPHMMATCPLCSENRRSKTSWRPHRQDRAEGRVFAIDHGLSRAARLLRASSNDQPGRDDRTRIVWQPRIGRDLTNEDTRQIGDNVTGFFAMLAEWWRLEMPANDGKLIASDNPEVHHGER
jgi:hypothetical protein